MELYCMLNFQLTVRVYLLYMFVKIKFETRTFIQMAFNMDKADSV